MSYNGVLPSQALTTMEKERAPGGRETKGGKMNHQSPAPALEGLQQDNPLFERQGNNPLFKQQGDNPLFVQRLVDSHDRPCIKAAL